MVPPPASAAAAPISVPAPVLITRLGDYSLTYAGLDLRLSESSFNVRMDITRGAAVLGSYPGPSSLNSRWFAYVEPDGCVWLYSGDVGLIVMVPQASPPGAAFSRYAPHTYLTDAAAAATVGRVVPRPVLAALPASVRQSFINDRDQAQPSNASSP